VIGKDTNVSWSAFHASKHQTELPQSISTLLPLFHEQAKSVAMLQHSMRVLKDATEFLNPGQVPVIAFDQPLYALGKQIQWDKPDIYGEDKYVLMFGGLHIEMAVLKAIGSWLEDSGWSDALVQADIASSGTADSFHKSSHVLRTRHAHQVTAASLYTLLRNAYEKYEENLDQAEPKEEFSDWCSSQSVISPQFKYWLMTLNFEILILMFITSLRSGNFELYKASLTKLMPWFFALDHHNYARWLSVHIRDMNLLHITHPPMHKEFSDGKFVVYKSKAPFSSIAIDQAHEQNNALVKGDGGAVGLTENAAALRRWMVAGPEVATLIEDFENLLFSSTMSDDKVHHDQTASVQKTFVKEVKSLTATMEAMGNPFTDRSGDLFSINNKDVADESVVNTVKNIVRIGQEQYKAFVNDRIVEKTVPFNQAIKRNSLNLFSCPPATVKSNAKLQLESLKSDCSLFSRLYIAAQTRTGNLDGFF
jgi:hypothetical protein